MRFAIKQAGSGSERIGMLSGFAKPSNTVIETPTSALFTQGGSIVHITADVLSKIFTSPQLLWVPLSNSIQLELGAKAQGDGVTKFAGLPDHLSIVSLQNMNEEIPEGHFEVDRVPLWTKYGKKMINADRYMDLMEVFKPDLILAIADGRVSLNDGCKRRLKSIARTTNMFDICVKRYKASDKLKNSSLVGVIVGAGDATKCKSCIEHILKQRDSLSGIALAGITSGPQDTMKVSTEELKTVFKDVAESLPKDLVLIVEGSWNPAIVVAAIELGWDVFDGTYPVKLSNNGHALKLEFDVTRSSQDMCILDLNDERYKEDFSPILDGCECLACRKHTRAYIRHLLNTKEMLSTVLLSIHNLHHFDQLFHNARRHIAENTFKLFKNHITKQYEIYKSSHVEPEETKVIITEGKKKTKIASETPQSNMANGNS